MSETSFDPDNGEFEQPRLPSVGIRLRLAREAKGLSLAEAGQALKLGSRQVEALENGDWGALPGITFIRGFVRNYARLVQVDSTSLMEQLDGVLEVRRPELALRESAHVTMPEPAGRSRRRDYAVASVGVMLAVLAALAYFFLPQDLSKIRDGLDAIIATYSRPAPPAGPVAPAASPASAAVPQGEPVLPPGATMSQVINPQSSASESAAAPAPTQESPAAALAPDEKAEASLAAAAPLHLSFTKESWVEIRDRRGNVVFSQRGTAGMERDVDGQAPFAIVIGYAPGVAIKYRGQNVDLAPFARGDVARLTLE
ncbi:MAG: helix-turn-helix domain-containing protein [Betaproteobacteria bacterium]